MFDAAELPDAAAPSDPDGECPVAALPSDRIEAWPGVAVALESAARAGDAPLSGWAWTVLQRPEGSNALPIEGAPAERRPRVEELDDPQTEAASFVPDVFGTYLLELVVTDAAGLSAPSARCDQAPALLEIVARPIDEGVQVELTWVTPADPEPLSGEGADLDLHLLHPAGQAWAQNPLACYFGNSAPDWGPAGPVGDCRLEVDDVNGTGPEVLTMTQPEDTMTYGAPYLVGVEYYRGDSLTTGEALGSSQARVRIFIDGELAFDKTETLRDTGDWWTVAAIDWPARRVESIGTVDEETPPTPRDEPGE